ncbi:MAG: class I SAM-dependent methyltransferase [Desulfomonilaceae bacterium]
MTISDYYQESKIKQAVDAGKHRDIVGGLWEELGSLQLAFLIKNGLIPSMRLLDVGCGCLRAGIKLVAFMDPGNYYGVDLNKDLIEAGYNIELAKKGLQQRLPSSNLLVESEFDCSPFGQKFHVAIAQSVFTHLPLNHIRLCLSRISAVMSEGGVFFASFFQCPEDEDVTLPLIHSPGEIKTFSARDPYHYKFSDLLYCAKNLPWRTTLIGDWGHPRGQMMCRFEKI